MGISPRLSEGTSSAAECARALEAQVGLSRRAAICRRGLPLWASRSASRASETGSRIGAARLDYPTAALHGVRRHIASALADEGATPAPDRLGHGAHLAQRN